jgi:hypothetical protein
LACSTSYPVPGLTEGNGHDFERSTARTRTLSHVAFIGDFNDWSTTATPLECIDGVWQTIVELPVGQHRCAFFVSGYDEFGQAWPDTIHEFAAVQPERELLLAS